MTDQENPELEKIVHAACLACGSEMTYSPERQMLECKHCGATRDLPKAADMIREQSFDDALNLADQPTGYGVEAKMFHCNGCGATTAVKADEVSFVCPFCGSDNVNQEAHESKVIRPAGILPFKVAKQNAIEKFKVWIGKGWFRPSKLKRLAKLDNIRSVYLPFWTYDANTWSNWTAMAGYHYYETETYYENGETKTRQVQKTRWVPASGYYEHAFDDVLVLGSKGLEQRFTEKIFPFELKEVVNYDSRYILGHDSEVYQKDVKEGFGVANGIMDTEIRSQVIKRIPGDTYRNLSINTQKDNITYKHILLPIWIAAYKFNNKVYRFLVNGQTGKISGSKPLSWGKIILLIAFIVAAGVAAYFIWGRDGGAQ